MGLSDNDDIVNFINSLGSSPVEPENHKYFKTASIREKINLIIEEYEQTNNLFTFMDKMNILHVQFAVRTTECGLKLHALLNKVKSGEYTGHTDPRLQKELEKITDEYYDVIEIVVDKLEADMKGKKETDE